MLLITQSLNLLLSASVGPIPPTPIPTGAIADGGGGRPIDIVIPRRKSDEPEYKPKLAPIPLRVQYDALLQAGAIDEDEWVGIMLLHGLDPVPILA